MFSNPFNKKEKNFFPIIALNENYAIRKNKNLEKRKTFNVFQRNLPNQIRRKKKNVESETHYRLTAMLSVVCFNGLLGVVFRIASLFFGFA